MAWRVRKLPSEEALGCTSLLTTPLPRVARACPIWQIEGSEYDAMRTFDFDAYRFEAMTIERPSRPLRQLLRNHSYVFVKDNGCFGDQLWVHSSIAELARSRLPRPFRDDHVDFNACCVSDGDQAGRADGLRGATIDNGCCAAVGKEASERCAKMVGGA